ncbi:gamma subclass chorismate mutase AroQ [Enterobacter asburiae]|uniref:gamma subclass chorismate mutase AroQ n=1 Tax=Enterobacter asburiae TaxID=61645 RepID=UPI0011D1D261|nr:gamma subclass chorismate mutase AroQ [Enterobacter asburiae]
MRYLAIVFTSFFMCGSSLAASVTATSIPDLADAINQRFEVMKDVAGYKLIKGLPVEDLPREEKVLKQTQRFAEEAKLDPLSIEGYIHAQMMVSKAIQYRYLDSWRIKPESHWQPKSLPSVREHILELDNRILDLISQQLLAGGGFSHQQTDMLRQLLDGRQISAWEKTLLIDNIVRITRR